MSRENCVRKAVDMLGLLHRAPRTIDELVTLTGYSKAAVTRWLRELCDEDLAKVIGERRDRGAVGARAKLYAWKHPQRHAPPTKATPVAKG